MRKFFSWLWKSLLILAILAGLLLGFSFLTGGRLAEFVVKEWGLPWKRPVPVQEHPREPDPWVYITETEAAKGVDRPQDLVRVQQDVHGDIRAKSVRIEHDANVYGSIEAAETLKFDGRFVQGDLKGKHVIIREDSDPWRHDIPWHGEAEERPIRIEGNVQGERILIGPEAVVTGSVGGEKSRVELSGHVIGSVQGETVVLTRFAVVDGDVILSGNMLNLEQGAQIRGRILTPKGDAIRINNGEGKPETDPEMHHVTPPTHVGEQHKEFVRVRDGAWNFGIFHWIPVLLGMLAVVTLSWLLRKEELEQVRLRVTGTFRRSLWIGLLTVIISIPVLFLLVISIIGIPFAIILAALLFLAYLAGFAALSIHVGKLLGEKIGLSEEKEILGVLLGALILSSLLWVPVLGWFLHLLAGLAGLGAAVGLWGPRMWAVFSEWRNKRKQ
ncbi:polymer-forming cytoskeletal protein [Staphylospora marina]|uniref:polymer-forming cytoskeletal protein n=1 Tax=Staphylospora marina TaxID=2490858 RepID=UPI0013DDB15B|nr:polymer-forming cytoskeletal protein [Staphylospora marina]